MTTHTPRKTGQGWVIEMPPEMAQAAGVTEGSYILLYAKDGHVEIEILPPPSPELKEEMREIYEEFKETFEELKRLGD